MAWFYELYSVNPQQAVVDLGATDKQLPSCGDYISESIFSIPWGHHVVIIGKCRNDQQKAMFYVNYEFSVVPWAYDQGKASDAGGH